MHPQRNIKILHLQNQTTVPCKNLEPDQIDLVLMRLISDITSNTKPHKLGSMNAQSLTVPCLFLLTFTHFSSTLSCFQLSVGQQIGIPVPSAYEAGFRGRALFSTAGEAFPQFKAALSLEATTNGRHSCSLVVLLGELKAWASDHRSTKFNPKDQCTLEMTKAGELKLKDTNGTVGWSSNTAGLGVKTVLLEPTGNLALINAENQTLWQTFDHPGDVMLWSQVLYAPSSLTASVADSAALYYSFEINRDRVALYLNSADGGKYSYWELNHTRDRNISLVKLGSEGLKVYGSNRRKIAQLLGTEAAEPVRFLMLGGTGSVSLYYYSALNTSFKASYRAPIAMCDLPFPCGQSGVCSPSHSCSCIQITSGEQNSSAMSCIKNLLPEEYCEVPYEVEMQNIVGGTTALRSAASVTNVTLEECLQSCVGNCSCLATVYANNSHWCFYYGVVGGIREADWKDGVSFWIKVPSVDMSKDERSSISTKLKIIIIAAVVDGMAICVLVGGLIYYLLVVRKQNDGMRRARNT